MDRECTPECTAYIDSKQFKNQDPAFPDIQCMRLLVDFTDLMTNTVDYTIPPEEFKEEFKNYLLSEDFDEPSKKQKKKK